jgi:hypothetical protein
LFTDGTHLTPTGYAVMADALAPRIERLIGMGPVKTVPMPENGAPTSVGP